MTRDAPSYAKIEIWLPLADALRNFIFDPTPDFVALIHGLRADPLPDSASRPSRVNRSLAC